MAKMAEPAYQEFGGNEEKTKEEFFAPIRRLAFVAVVVSTMTTFALTVTVPMAYNYVQYVHSMLDSEVEFCKVGKW